MGSYDIPASMKALVKKEEASSYSYTTVPVEEPGQGEVLIKVDCVSICGSDIALYKWDNVARSVTPGTVSLKTESQIGLGCMFE